MKVFGVEDNNEDTTSNILLKCLSILSNQGCPMNSGVISRISTMNRNTSYVDMLLMVHFGTVYV